jgi:hypothetical protein
MNDTLSQWLAGCALAPGMLGYSVRLPDGTFLSHSFRENYPRERLDETLRLLANSLELFPGHGLEPRWETWTFTQCQIRFIIRPDGLLLALAAEPNTPAAQNLDLLTGEFLELDFGH